MPPLAQRQPGVLGGIEVYLVMSLSEERNKFRLAISESVLFLGNVLSSLHLSINHLSGCIPGTVSSLTKLSSLELFNNQLSGYIPDAVSSLTELDKLIMVFNQMSGCIPGGVASLTELSLCFLKINQLSGCIPGAVSSLTKLAKLGLGSNELSGCIPGAVSSLTALSYFGLWQNRFSGAIPGAVAFLTTLSLLDLVENHLSGCVPGAVSSLTELSELRLHKNKLCCPIPDAISLIANLRCLHLKDNQLRGRIPGGLLSLPRLSVLVAGSNILSGTLGSIESPLQWLQISDNELIGSCPVVRHSQRLTVWACSGNMWEGTLPGELMRSSRLKTMDLSQTAGQVGGLRGQLPPMASHGIALKHLMMSHQSLEGFVPPFRGTLSTLALQGNRFRLFQSAKWTARSIGPSLVLMHMNLLSCSLPACGGVGTNFSLVALGNSIEHFDMALPEWVSPVERGGLFWRSGAEGRSLLLKIVCSTGLLVTIIAAKFRGGMLLRVFLLWQIGPFHHLRFVSASSLLLVHIAHQVFLRMFIFVFLLSWAECRVKQRVL